MVPDQSFNEPNLDTTDVRRQHTVPRMYLSHFAVDGRLSAYDFEEDKEFAASVRNVAVRTGFYDIWVEGRKLSTESWLATIESAAASIISGLGANPDMLLSLSDEDEVALSRFLCAQMFRVQAFRDSDAVMRQQLVDHLKQAGRAFLERTESPEVAARIWEAWKDKPDEWFLHEEDPYQPAKTTAFVLAEVQGFANVLSHMPRRVGVVNSQMTLYTSDNPVSRHPLPTVRFANFSMWRYFVPLAPSVLLQIGPGLAQEGEPRYRRKDFSEWEASFARHVISRDASRFLYGPRPYLSKECALSCLRRIDTQKLRDAVRLQEFDPRKLR